MFINYFRIQCSYFSPVVLTIMFKVNMYIILYQISMYMITIYYMFLEIRDY